jgi:hypothetical protein
MKKIINILLLFIFTTTFFACDKEIIKPTNGECKSFDCLVFSDDNDDLTRDAREDFISIDDNVTDPDEEEDFEEDEVTDPDEEEDFEEDEVTDPDEEEDFEEEEFSK